MRTKTIICRLWLLTALVLSILFAGSVAVVVHTTAILVDLFVSIREAVQLYVDDIRTTFRAFRQDWREAGQ